MVLYSFELIAEFLGTKHHELIYTANDVQDALPEVIRYLESFDAPLVHSAVPMYFVSKLAAEHVKVVLSGEGADELFAGYSPKNENRYYSNSGVCLYLI